jgi:hypothetical protein
MVEQEPVAAVEFQESTDAREANIVREAIAGLAYSLWQSRGCPEGTPDEDWYNAEDILRTSVKIEESVTREGNGDLFSRVALQQSAVGLSEIFHNQSVDGVREISIDIERYKLAPQL